MKTLQPGDFKEGHLLKTGSGDEFLANKHTVTFYKALHHRLGLINPVEITTDMLFRCKQFSSFGHLRNQWVCNESVFKCKDRIFVDENKEEVCESIKLIMEFDEYLFYRNEILIKSIVYIHELQATFLEHTGEELKINT